VDDKSTPVKKIRLAAIVVLLGMIGWGTQEHWSPLFASTSVDTAAPDKPVASKPKSRGKSVPVIVEAVGETRDTVLIEAIGTGRAQQSVMMFPAAAGEIIEVPIETGEIVKKDQVVMRLDSRDARLLVKLAQTRVKEAESALTRATRLRDNNVRSKANVEDADIILERAKLELNQAQEALSDRTMRAPFDGVVGMPSVEAGDRITMQSDVMTIDDRSIIWVEFDVAERNLARLKTSMPVTARTPTFSDRDIKGYINKIDSRIDPVSRTVRVRAAFPNTEDELRPGMSFFVAVNLAGPMLPSVPELALQWQNGESFVWRVTEGKATKVNVISKRRLNNKILIEGDIKPGDIVVVEGVQRLRDGRLVEISASEGS
jgi:membrane fusion protein (multidrug efflux system)